MIPILFTVPYPEMRDTVLDVFESHPKRRQLSRTINVVQAEKLDGAALKGSIIIARGLTYQRIKSQFPHLPCVEVLVHTSDIIAALLDCRQSYRPKRIGLIGHYPFLPPPETLSALIGCEIIHYPQESLQALRQLIDKALDEGADAFAGGYSLCHWARTNGYPASIVASSREAIRNAIDEALRTYDILQENEISRIALENAREAVLYTDAGRIVNYLNPAARQQLSALGLPADPLGQTLRQALPFLAPLLGGTADGEGPLAFDDELFDCNNVKLTVSARPAFIGDSAVGSVVTLNTVESIRRQEYSIRERLSEKGLSARYTFGDILCGSARMRQLVAKAKKCALVSSNVMLIGETGTGKELFAQSIHNHSARKRGPFLAINCAALPEHLIESELFGYSEGAFTGARRGGKLGLIETAHGGTLFLDEISELPIAVQGKLLRVLQEREVRRVGDDRVTTVDVRVISASNIPLPDSVRAGRFRRDLLYRLDILNLGIPPLRERREDIPLLFWHYVREYNALLGGAVEALAPEAERLLVAHPFEGNARELRNVAERLCVLCEGAVVEAEEMRDCLRHGAFAEREAVQESEVFGAEFDAESLRRSEEKAVGDALRRAGGNRTLAAKMLGIDRSTLWRKLRRMKRAATALPG